MIVHERAISSQDKIKDLDALTQIIVSHKADGRRIALCHGVFDVLHLGHIRYFEQAKRLGDLLVVTVTPDRYVNKGPHRPAFPEQFRAEAIAALGCVDYVAINQWPLAQEAIHLLKPDYYVKGSDYKNAEKDHTGGIVLEEQAVESVGGKIVFTDDITFSSSTLVNRHLSIFPEEVKNYLASVSARYRALDVIELLDTARTLKVLVVGESIIDEYQYCEAIGKSSKEPTLAVKLLSSEKFAGGILAVGNHVASFSDRVSMVTFLGSENSQENFVREKVNSNIEKLLLYRRNSPTIVKRRFIDQYFFTKLLETYEMNDGALEAAENEKLCNVLNERLPSCDVVIVVDFGHGVLTEEAIDILCGKSRFLAVNAQSNAGNLGYHTISRYRRADYICMAENEMRLEARDRRGDLEAIVVEASRRLDCGRVVVTRGKKGCLCYSDQEGFSQAPALAGQVVDRVGAGDAFLSVTALCVAQNAPMSIVGLVGNVVGAQAVATVGNRTPIQRVPLFKHIESLLK